MQLKPKFGHIMEVSRACSADGGSVCKCVEHKNAALGAEAANKRNTTYNARRATHFEVRLLQSEKAF